MGVSGINRYCAKIVSLLLTYNILIIIFNKAPGIFLLSLSITMNSMQRVVQSALNS